MIYYSTKTIADKLGVTRWAVHQMATRHGIGSLPTPNARVFSEDDLVRLRAISTGKPGRPKR